MGWTSALPSSFLSAGVVLALDNPSQTAVGDRDQIEMTDWSAARTLQHTRSNEKEIKKAFCRKKRDKKLHSWFVIRSLHGKRKISG